MRELFLRLISIGSWALAMGMPVSGSAQGPAEARFGETHWVGDTEVDLVVTQTGAQTTVEVVTEHGSRRLYRGRPASAFAEPSADGLLVAIVDGEVRVALVPIRAQRPGPAELLPIRREGNPDRTPIGAAVVNRPDGFVVFWQEASMSNPSQPYATFAVDLNPDGRPRGTARSVPAPWPIADATWLDREGRYYLALYYGQGPGQTRLCGVHLTGPGLVPQEHPFWVTHVGEIDEVRLVTRGDRVIAVFRDGRALRAVDVTGGQWGADPNVSVRDYGEIQPSATFRVSRDADPPEVSIRALLGHHPSRRN